MSRQQWEIIQKRGVATLSVWAMDPAFGLVDCDLAAHSARMAELPVLARAVAEAEGELSDRRAAFGKAEAKLEDLSVRAPAVLGGFLPAGDPLLAQLGPIHAEEVGFSTVRSLRRARLVHGLWADFDAARAADTPPGAPLVLPYRHPASEDPPVAVAAADFDTLAETDVPDAAHSRDDALRALRLAKSALRAAARVVDADNKRWSKAWLRFYPAGTPEGDAARSQVPRLKPTPRPTPLEIAALEAVPGGMVTVRYADSGGGHATTLELLHRRAGDGDFGSAVPVERPTQTVGPFAPGETLTFRTRAGNSRKKDVASGLMSVVVI